MVLSKGSLDIWSKPLPKDRQIQTQLQGELGVCCGGRGWKATWLSPCLHSTVQKPRGTLKIAEAAEAQHTPIFGT